MSAQEQINTPETFAFNAEVGKLLQIVAKSLYAEREVFLRELISNASDASEHHRYLTLTNDACKGQDTDYQVIISADKDGKTLTIADNGVGMTRDELIEHLGTIARSGTANLVEHLSQAANDASNKGRDLIGQFGVGFYSVFMVADRVDVISQSAKDTTQTWHWHSDGASGYQIESTDTRDGLISGRGTTITLHLKDDADEFLEPLRIKNIVSRYANHMSIPVKLAQSSTDADPETINKAVAIWHQPKDRLSQEEYEEFYKSMSFMGDKPWLNAHWRAEGRLEYTALLYVPSMRPFDLFDPRRQHAVKLYVRRVFITENCDGLIPAYLRFLRGVVDAEDLPLNVSRENLQHSPILAKIRAGITKKMLGTIAKLAEQDEKGYKDFLFNFGAVLKEGLYEDAEHRTDIFDLLRFKTVKHPEDGISLKQYLEEMPKGQESIYYLIGEKAAHMTSSPYLEGFAARDVDVLLLEDEIDPFWLTQVMDYDGTAFKSVTKASSDLDKIAKTDVADAKDAEQNQKAEPANEAAQNLTLKFLNETLGAHVRKVQVSNRLTSSAVCLVTEEGDLDLNMERLLRQQKHMDQSYTRILEVNPTHPVVAKLMKRVGEIGEPFSKMGANEVDTAWLLLDMARIADGDTALDPARFSERLGRVLMQTAN